MAYCSVLRKEEVNKDEMYPQAAHLVRVRYPSLSQTQTSALATLAFFAAHVPLALLMRLYPRVGFLHVIATLALGLWWTTSKSRPELVAYTAAYIMGAEVLWRMTETPIFWETGKYAVVVILGVSILIRGRLKPPPFPFLYFALLLPSTLLVAESMSLDTARQQLSFNLSGPVALMVSAWFFSEIELSRPKMLRLFSALIGPIVGIATLAIFSTLTTQGLQFTTDSNKHNKWRIWPKSSVCRSWVGCSNGLFLHVRQGSKSSS